MNRWYSPLYTKYSSILFRDRRHLGEEAAGQLQDADLPGADRQGEDLDQAERCLVTIKLGDVHRQIRCVALTAESEDGISPNLMPLLLMEAPSLGQKCGPSVEVDKRAVFMQITTWSQMLRCKLINLSIRVFGGCAAEHFSAFSSSMKSAASSHGLHS